jgi:hypothetical protein
LFVSVAPVFSIASEPITSDWDRAVRDSSVGPARAGDDDRLLVGAFGLRLGLRRLGRFLVCLRKSRSRQRKRAQGNEKKGANSERHLDPPLVRLNTGLDCKELGNG